MKNKTKWVSFNCEECNKETETRVIYYKRRQHHFCGRACQVEWQKSSRLRKNNPYWKGGNTYLYKKIKIGGKYINEHQYIVETTIGRKLTKGEEVHHIDYDTRNNSKDNLLLCKNKAEHRSYHRKVCC